MKKQLEQLLEFQRAYNSTRNSKPTLISEDDYVLRYKLGKEELIEYFDACKDGDLIEVADALADQLYILLGTMISHGMQDVIEDIFDEVHRSNMSKLGRPPNLIHLPTRWSRSTRSRGTSRAWRSPGRFRTRAQCGTTHRRRQSPWSSRCPWTDECASST